MFAAKILVVDDEKYIRNFVSQALTRDGHEVSVACSGEEGLAAFERGSFDLIVTDVKMENMDGIEMLRQIRQIDGTVVAVVITALRDQKTALRALACGVHDFLIKPFTLEELQEHVANALVEREKIVENRLLIGDLMQTRSVLQRQLLEQDEKLTQTERYLNHLIDSAPFGVVSTDKEDVLLTFNGVAEEMYGYRRLEVLGRTATQVFGEVLEPGYTTHCRKDGTQMSVLVHTQAILNDEQEEIAHLYVLEDQSEKELLESQLFQAERLSVLGQMAPRIAHEFKTPLQVVSGNAELAKIWLEQGDIDQALDTIERILPATDQLVYMVKQMTNLGKPTQNRQVSMKVVEVLDRLLGTLQPLGVLKYCTIERDYLDPELQIYGDPTQVEQVFSNLIINAAHAMEKATEKSLHITVSEEFNKVIVTIQDTGCGIPEGKLEEIFQPFYTTKPEGKGTGLGLAIVRSMLRRHQADVQVNSEVDVGTTFVLKFPVYSSENLAEEMEVLGE